MWNKREEFTDFEKRLEIKEKANDYLMDKWKGLSPSGSHATSRRTLLDLDLTPLHVAHSILASQLGFHTLSWAARP